MAEEIQNCTRISAAARDLAAWIAAQPDGAATLRQVQREAPSRAARRDALAVLAAAEAMGLVSLLPPGSLVGGVPRRQAWLASGQAAPRSLPTAHPAAEPTVRHAPPEPCDMDSAEACDTKAESVRHGPSEAGVRHGLYPDAAALLDHLRKNGPATHLEAAAVLGWQAMRAWRAEDRLCRAGLVHYPVGAGTMHAKP